MSPSIVSKNGKTILVAGSPGGSRIITTTLEVIANVIDRRMAVNAADKWRCFYNRETWQKIKSLLKNAGLKGIRASHYSIDSLRACR